VSSWKLWVSFLGHMEWGKPLATTASLVRQTCPRGGAVLRPKPAHGIIISAVHPPSRIFVTACQAGSHLMYSSGDTPVCAKASVCTPAAVRIRW
jgi:hypothetical protein